MPSWDPREGEGLGHPVWGGTQSPAPAQACSAASGQRGSSQVGQTEHSVNAPVGDENPFPLLQVYMTPGSGDGISATRFVIPAKLAQMFQTDAMINSSRGEPRERICLQEPVCQNTSLLRARALPAAAGLDGRVSGLRTILQLDEALLWGICWFFTLSGFPEEAALAFIAPSGVELCPWRAAGSPGARYAWRRSDYSLRKLSGLLCSDTACPCKMLMRFL